MLLPGQTRQQKKGTGARKRWTPEAVLRAGFAPPTEKARHTGIDGASHAHALNSRITCAQAVEHQQEQGLKRLRDAAETEDLAFFISTNMFDASKFPVRCRKNRRARLREVLASHSQVTWGTGGRQVFDQAFIRRPRVLRPAYTAGSQWAVVGEGDAASIAPPPHKALRARFKASVTVSDSHTINKLTNKYARLVLPKTHLLLPCYCFQHRTGSGVEDITTTLGGFTDIWCAAKTFEDYDFVEDTKARIRAYAHKRCEVVETYEPREHDLPTAFGEALLDECYVQGKFDHGPAAPQVQQRTLKAKRFLKFFPTFSGPFCVYVCVCGCWCWCACVVCVCGVRVWCACVVCVYCECACVCVCALYVCVCFV